MMKFFTNRKAALEALSAIEASKRALVDSLRITLRKGNPSKNWDGGDYDRWLECSCIVMGLYRATEQWSSVYDIERYEHLDGYVVVSQDDLDDMDSIEIHR